MSAFSSPDGVCLMILAADESRAPLFLENELQAFYGVRAFRSGVYSTLVPAQVRFISSSSKPC